MGIKCTKLYSNSFKFHIFIARRLGSPFFVGHSVSTPLQAVLAFVSAVASAAAFLAFIAYTFLASTASIGRS